MGKKRSVTVPQSRGFWGGQQRTELDLESSWSVIRLGEARKFQEERKLWAEGSTAQRTQS